MKKLLMVAAVIVVVVFLVSYFKAAKTATDTAKDTGNKNPASPTQAPQFVPTGIVTEVSSTPTTGTAPVLIVSGLGPNISTGQSGSTSQGSENVNG